jgi:hypothetical protein
MRKTATKKAAAPKPPEVEFFYDEVEQRSEEWFDLRRGIPTASKFSAVMAEGRDGGESLSRQTYMELLAGELISGQTAETFRSEAMRRGVAMEPIARDYYAKRRFDEVVEVGFARRKLPSGRYVGASPDAQIGGREGRKGLEIKSVKHDEMVRLINGPGGGFPPRFKWQIHGTMLVTGWDAVDLLVYADNMGGIEFRIERDEHKIKELHDALQVFDFDLHVLVKRTRERMG